MTRVGNEIYNLMLMVAGVPNSRHIEIGSPSESSNRIGLTFIHFLVSANSTVRLFEADGRATITAISQANPAQITTSVAHGLVTGQQVDIRGSDSGTTVDGTRTATVTGSTTFTVPVNNSGGPAGSAGSVLLDTSPISGIYELQGASLARSPLLLGDGGSIIVVSSPGKGIWLASQATTSAGAGICKAVEVQDRLYASSDAP